ncbi:hypothetical protein, partial [Agrococcus sp. HG114]|uniref:hypothetical protein n=1 Tax=Agrococcus sp. HG114 TaxID=2969757 RepID=UPI00215A995A
LVGAALALGACAAGGEAPRAPTPSAEPAADARVLLEIVQLRGDVTSGHIELRVTNEGDELLEVTRAVYESTRWSAPMVRDDDARIPAGARRNLRLQLPRAVCGAGPLEHRAVVELADGRRLEGAPEDPLGQLERLDDAECDLRAFERDVAAVAWLEPAIPADGSGPAVVRLELAPVARAQGEAGTIAAVDATALLAPLDASGTRTESLPVGAALEPGAPPSVVEVPLVPGRCDLHAVAEDKQGTLFRIRATRGGEPVDLLLPSPDAQRDALLDWVVARCAVLG